MQILLIEDVRVERKTLKRWIEDLGCEVIEASNGIEGLTRYKDHRPALVISDIVMPGGEGIQMMIDLQRDFPGVKIFAISGAGRDPGQYLRLAEGVGAMRTFAKPIVKEELLGAVKEQFPQMACKN